MNSVRIEAASTVPLHEIALDVAADKALIAELRRRGYRVYPERRVRIHSSTVFVSRREVERLRQVQGFNDHTQHRLAIEMAQSLAGSGAYVRSREDVDDFAGGDRGVRYRAQVCVVLPNDFDFEAEMWGIR